MKMSRHIVHTVGECLPVCIFFSINVVCLLWIQVLEENICPHAYMPPCQICKYAKCTFNAQYTKAVHTHCIIGSTVDPKFAVLLLFQMLIAWTAVAVISGNYANKFRKWCTIKQLLLNMRVHIPYCDLVWPLGSYFT